MTPEQIVRHFDNSTAFTAYNLGFSDAAVRKWLKNKRVPLKTQKLIQALTAGKLKADGK